MKKVISILLILCMISAILVGCGSTDKKSDNSVDNTKTDVKTDDTSDKDVTSEEGKTGSEESDPVKDPYGLPNDLSAYPVKDNPTLTYWWPIDGFQAVAIKDMNEHEVWKEIQKITGVNIKFIHPTVGQESEQFNLMIASDDLPDLICQSDRYKGGVTVGIDDGVFIDHTEVIDKYAPNYKKFRESDEDRRRTTMDDKGRILGFYNIAPYSEWIWFGALIKQEALDKTGLPVPETMDEWYNFFKKCQEVGYKSPLMFNTGSGTIFTGYFCSAYGAYDWLFIDKQGKVQWGPVQPGMKDYLAEIRKWYEEGLIDKDFATRDFSSNMAYAISADCAVAMDSPDTMWGVWKEQNNIDFVAAPYPVLNKGDKPTTTYKHWKNGGWPTSITTECKNVEAAARFLDFGYTKKGWELCNFGLPDRTHKIDEKGMPYYQKESIMWNDPENIPLSNRVWKYKLHQGPFVREEHNSNPLLVSPGSYSGDIRKMWTEGTDASPAVPPVTFTSEESSREADIGSKLATLRSETFLKIIMGQVPVSEFDNFVKTAEKMGLNEWLGIWQTALDRYNAR